MLTLIMVPLRTIQMTKSMFGEAGARAWHRGGPSASAARPSMRPLTNLP
jgi:hypothetical protein